MVFAIAVVTLYVLPPVKSLSACQLCPRESVYAVPPEFIRMGRLDADSFLEYAEAPKMNSSATTIVRFKFFALIVPEVFIWIPHFDVVPGPEAEPVRTK